MEKIYISSVPSMEGAMQGEESKGYFLASSLWFSCEKDTDEKQMQESGIGGPLNSEQGQGSCGWGEGITCTYAHEMPATGRQTRKQIKGKQE